MEQLNFKVLDFEGPLDLLLALIKKNKVSICRIPGVAVKCVEIWRNTGGEGGPLDED